MPLSRMTKLSWIYELYQFGNRVHEKGWKLEIYQRLLNHIVTGFEAKSGSLSLLDKSRGKLIIVAGIDLPAGVVGTVVGEGVLSWVMEHGTAVLMNGDVSSDPRFKSRARENRDVSSGNSSVCWPLTIEERVIGVISVNRTNVSPAYTEEVVEQGNALLKIVSLALANIELHLEHNKQIEALNEVNSQLKITQALKDQAEAAKAEQMNALAEANVRMMLFHSAMEDLGKISANIVDIDEVFYKQILTEAMNLTSSLKGSIVLFDENGKLTQLCPMGMSAEEAETIFPHEGKSELLRNLLNVKKALRAEQHSSVEAVAQSDVKNNTRFLAIPLVISDVVKGALYLADKRDGNYFSDNEEMIASLLISELEHVMERCILMSSLNDSNKELMQEKGEQGKLIQQLQEAQSHLLQSEKMASIGQLAAGVAHEINNPIGYVYSNLGTLEKYVQDLFRMLDKYEQSEAVISDAEVKAGLQAARKSLDIAFLKEDLGSLMSESRDGITRVKNIVQNLKDFSHVDAADEWQFADLHAGINSTLNIVNNEIKYKAEVVMQLGDIPNVECLPSQLNQVFMNLLVNASHAIEERGLITVRSGTQGDSVWVEVEDTGKGISPENIKKIFDPFFTTKPIGKGTGLGLSLSYGIIQKHHGNIDVTSSIGKGTTFRVTLPVKRAADVESVSVSEAEAA